MMHDEKFEKAIKVVLLHEGKLSNSPNDAGGITQYGISLRFLKAAGMDINLDGKIDSNDVLALECNAACEIYKKCFWDKYEIYKIDSVDIATKLLDLSINLGATQAVKILQNAVNKLLDKPVDIDGLLGQETIKAVNKAPTLSLLNQFKLNAEHFYINLVADKPQLHVFLKGWLNRAKA